MTIADFKHEVKDSRRAANGEQTLPTLADRILGIPVN
jgi:hypothetical protein